MKELLLNIAEIAAFMALVILPFAIILQFFVLLWGEGSVKYRLNRLWSYFSGQTVSDSPAKMAQFTLRSHSRLFGPPFSFRSLVLMFFISCGSSAAAILIGRVIETGAYPVFLWETLNRTTRSLLPWSNGFYQTEYLFSFRFLCDYIMLLITLRCARKISENRGFFSRLGMISGTLFWAFLFSFISIVSIKVIAGLSRSRPFDGELVLSAYEQTIHTVITFIIGQGEDFDSLLFGAAGLIPTAFYLLLFLPVMIIHLWDRMIHKIAEGLGERFFFVKIPALLGLLLLIYSLAEILEWLARRKGW